MATLNKYFELKKDLNIFQLKQLCFLVVTIKEMQILKYY